MELNTLGDWKVRFPNFKPAEVFSPDILAKGRHLINLDALDRLQAFRAWLGKSFVINSVGRQLRGQRSWAEQQKANPGVWSCHVVGCAFDCTPLWLFGGQPESERITLLEFKQEALAFGWSGVGFYPVKNFVHIDCRALRSGQTEAVQWGE